MPMFSMMYLQLASSPASKVTTETDSSLFSTRLGIVQLDEGDSYSAALDRCSTPSI